VTGRKAGKWLGQAAVLWVMDEAPAIPARLRYARAVIARFADEDGRGAYPSAAEVARITGKTVAQARRDIAELARLGQLLPGDPGLVKHIRADRRPNVYDLPMPRGAQGDTPSGSPRGAQGDTPSGSPRGAQDDTPSGSPRGARMRRTGSAFTRNGVRKRAPRTNQKKKRTSPQPPADPDSAEGATAPGARANPPGSRAPDAATDPRTILLGMDDATEEEIGFIIAALTPKRPDLAVYLRDQAAKDEGRGLIAWARRQLARDRPGPRRAPVCEDCGRPYTAAQLADDEFYRRAMAGTAGCVHEEPP
jgi:hypothetical protein